MQVAAAYDWGKWKKLDEKLVANVDEALAKQIPALLAQLGTELDERAAREKELHSSFMEGGGAAVVASTLRTDSAHIRMGGGGGAGGPAAGGAGAGGAGAGAPSEATAHWAAVVNKVEADAVFKLQPGAGDGRLSGADAKDVRLETRLDVAVLRRVWDLADIDRDGFLDRDEFAVAWWLIGQAKAGKDLPSELPPAVIPPHKRAAGGAGGGGAGAGGGGP